MPVYVRCREADDGEVKGLRYQISEIRLNPEEYADRENRMSILERKILRKLRIKEAEIRDIRILKESVDARKKPQVFAVYTLAFDCGQQLPLRPWTEERYIPPNGEEAARKIRTGEIPRPVIAGFGPCGLFAALILAGAGCRPIVLERGKPVEKRMRDVEQFWQGGGLNPESNVQFGEGGAGTFSDGKLTTGIRDKRIRLVLEEFVSAGAGEEILYRQRPHIGTDRLRRIIPRIREKILSLGGEIRFETKLTGLITEQIPPFEKSAGGEPPDPESPESRRPAREKAGDRRLSGVRIRCGGREERLPAEHLILAVGHSARDTFRMLREEGAAMEPKPFSIGVRVEHPQRDIDRAQYGYADQAKIFGPAEYRLSHRCENGRGVYTFCMCPGGQVINASSGGEQAVTNGMSNGARDGAWANSGLLVDVRVEDFARGDDPLAGVAFQRKYEQLAWEQTRRQNASGAGLPVSTWERFRDSDEDPVCRSLPGFAVDGIREAMPYLGRKLRGFDREDTRMTAVESRSSSPVRVLRDEEGQSTIRGLMPAGEGPGYAGGIMSAAVDGIRAAERVIERMNAFPEGETEETEHHRE
ncbi:MAG: NAD(FAD)-utilizing dehydrogenase [Bacillota bacterium]|nr:NAD(FAD)-utilizing dehydrogenase [Bacillota bacterium]